MAITSKFSGTACFVNRLRFYARLLGVSFVHKLDS